MPKRAKLAIIDGEYCKECTKCLALKKLEEFNNSVFGVGGKRGQCKECENIANKINYKNNKNNVLERSRERRLEKYGINSEEYDKLYLEQEGKCSICNNKFEVLSVDHCHDSNKVRGLLCTHCNFGVGHFKNSIELLENAIKYLKRGQ